MEKVYLKNGKEVKIGDTLILTYRSENSIFGGATMIKSVIVTVDNLPKLIEAARGRTLVLFTSYDSLKYSYNSCVSAMESQGIMMFKHNKIKEIYSQIKNKKFDIK